jgi:SSS family solute:Na+ symporter
MEAEMLYLRIISDNVPGWLLGLLTIGFAAASMSCTDTFATSGASCLSRDLVQRHLWPTATVKEMLILNRILIVIMVFISALIALNVDSIMDAVIIATVIGTTSYFFPIIGGLYWKRATTWGARAALVAGGGTQILLVSYEQFWLKAPLDSISPYLVEHGVLVGLSLSALFFVGVSLATRQAEDIRLAPFFTDIAERVFQGDLPRVDRTNPDYLKIASDIEEKSAGDRIHLRLTIEYSQASEESAHQLLMWKPFIEKLQERHPVWFTPTGSHVAYRLSQADMQACIKMVHGTSRQIWLNSEPRQEEGDRQRDELVIAYQEIGEVLLELGLQASPRT